MKSTLWALAFACMAVSCSDDIDNPNKGGDDNGLQGQSAYMKVTVNSEITTRANPTGGEEGDRDEAGSLEESNVNDVTVILYDAVSTDDYNFVGQTNKIIAAGWAVNADGTIGGTVNKHDWTATVKLSFTDQAGDWDGKTFGIIAVTNLGKENDLLEAINGATPSIETGDQLADYLQTEYKTGNGFVMSTHTTTWGGTATTITLDADANEDNAPKAEVFVERLAAKVRINEGEAISTGTGNIHLGNFVYALGGDRVVLQNVAVVNQLSSGSYLLKRVTTDAIINGTIEYLGDESSAANGEGINYVIDPWTIKKTYPYTDYSGLGGSTKLNYINHFEGDRYSVLWMNLTSGSMIKLNNNGGDAPYQLCYTMENTTSKEASLNGYSTGALFQATYYPAQWTAVQDDDSTDPTDVKYGTSDDKTIEDVTPNATESFTGETFYVYNQTIYKDYEAILAGFLNAALEGTKKDTDLTISDFGEDKIASLTVAKFKASKASGVKDEFGYIAYLSKRAVELGEDDSFVDTDSFKNFYETNNDCNKKNVREYKDGVCYYPYWIRHANNNKPADMGVMEFGIVRNNIYDLTVSQISQLGLSWSDVPDPEGPDEDGDARMVVNIHVKNWVVRNNGGIIL